MNRKEINLLGMLESVVKGLDINEPLISDKPAIMAVKSRLKRNIVVIKGLKQKQAVGTKADTAIKNYKREDMTANLLNVAAGIAAVGAEKNDVRLKMTGAVKEPVIKDMRESDLVIRAHGVYETAMSIAPELVTWGISQDEIDDLGASSDSYLDQNQTIRNIKAKSVEATTEIKQKLNESYNLIKDPLDALMLPFKKINPTFYGEYLNTRLIIDRAATHQKAEQKTIAPK